MLVLLGYWREQNGLDGMYTLKDFLKFSGNLDAMRAFYLTYVHAVVTSKKFDYILHKQELKKGMVISTVSDDAFALAAIKNGEDVWLDILAKSDGKIRPMKQNEEIPQSWITTKVPKYTDPRKGWKKEGILWFNMFHGQMKKFWNQHPNFIYDLYVR